MTNFDPTTFITDKMQNGGRGSASPYGFHFISAFSHNKRNFYLEHILGLTHLHPKPALTFGSTIHDAFEAYFSSNRNVEVMLHVFTELHTKRRPLYKEEPTWKKNLPRGRTMLLEWANTYGSEDPKNEELLLFEEELTFPLRNNFPMTFRPDYVVRNLKTGRVVLRDIKTTGYSLKAMGTSVALQDQSTTYLLGLQRARPDLAPDLLGLEPDILFSRDGRSASVARPLVITRTPDELLSWELSLIGLFGDLYRRLTLLEEGYDPFLLFPRNGKDGAYFGDDYGDISRKPLTSADPALPDYFIDEEKKANITHFPYLWTQTEDWAYFSR